MYEYLSFPFLLAKSGALKFFAESSIYLQSILAVGEVLQHYDSDQRFPAWGFGGRPIDGPVSHCFALNGNQQAAEVFTLKIIFFDNFAFPWIFSLARR